MDSEYVEQESGQPEQPRAMFRKLHIFTREGKTFSFQGVHNVRENETYLTFWYTAQSDGLGKVARFFIPNIAGYTVSME